MFIREKSTSETAPKPSTERTVTSCSSGTSPRLTRSLRDVICGVFSPKPLLQWSVCGPPTHPLHSLRNSLRAGGGVLRLEESCR